MKLIDLPKISDPRGNLTFIEGNNHIPFQIARVFWIYDVPGGETRGGHAYKTNQEFIIALSGSFDVVLDDGKQKTKHNLNRSYYGLFVPKGTWRHMENFSTNALALVIASCEYNENDYVRDYNNFLKLTTTNKLIQGLNISEPISLEKKTSIFANSKIIDCEILSLPINHRDKGNISVIENSINIPFKIKRVYYLYDIPGGEERGGHAHKNLYQLVIASSGSFDVIIDDGNNKKTIHLNRPNQGLLIVPGIWRELTNFSSDSTCLVMASEVFDEDDYIRDYKDFNLKKNEIQ